MTIPTCIITGRIAGDSDACGDCDPCGAAHTVPDAVRRLLAEKDEWRSKYAEAMEREPSIANCQHPRIEGTGSISSDGSGWSDNYCLDCHKRWRNEWPCRTPEPSSAQRQEG